MIFPRFPIIFFRPIFSFPSISFHFSEFVFMFDLFGILKRFNILLGCLYVLYHGYRFTRIRNKYSILYTFFSHLIWTHSHIWMISINGNCKCHHKSNAVFFASQTYDKLVLIICKTRRGGMAIAIHQPFTRLEKNLEQIRWVSFATNRLAAK